MDRIGREGLADPLLTDKQIAVLDLLVQHRTSKEIARELGISPHTVEQRLNGAKHKLGVTRRGDLANAWLRAKALCEKPVYEEIRITPNALPLSEQAQPGERTDLIVPAPAQASLPAAETASQPVNLVPAVLTGRNGALMRITAVFAIAAGMTMVCIGGLAVLEQLSRLVA